MDVSSEAISDEWKPVESQELAKKFVKVNADAIAPSVVVGVQTDDAHSLAGVKKQDDGIPRSIGAMNVPVSDMESGMHAGPIDVPSHGGVDRGSAQTAVARESSDDENAIPARLSFDTNKQNPALSVGKLSQRLSEIDARTTDAEDPSSRMDVTKKVDATNPATNIDSTVIDNSMDGIMAINSAEDKPTEPENQVGGGSMFATPEAPVPSVMEVLNQDVVNHDHVKRVPVFEEEHGPGNTITEEAINSAIASAIAGNALNKPTEGDSAVDRTVSAVPDPSRPAGFPEGIGAHPGCMTGDAPTNAPGAVVVPPLPAGTRDLAAPSSGKGVRKKRSVQHVTTLAKRAEIMAWMRAQHTAGQTRIPSKAVAAFPDEFRGSANSRLMKASRYFRLRDTPPPAQMAKARPGRGRKKAAWSAALAADVAAEIARLRAAGVRISHEVVKTAACSTLVNRQRDEYAPGLVAKINNRWVLRFIETHPGVLGPTPARKAGST